MRIVCVRHPAAVSHRGHCVPCLLEEALAPPSDQDGRITIQLPLGRSASTSVFLVKASGPGLRLLRLKTWHRPAPAGFLARLAKLQEQLSEWRHPAIPVPLAARVDAAGHPAVLSEFRQGLPILARVESGALDPTDAEACLTALRAVVRQAHERGLVHGAISSGNVILAPRGEASYLLDFGQAALVLPDGDDRAVPSDDIAGFDRLIRSLRPAPSSFPHRP